jgi:hypothetical protein
VARVGISHNCHRQSKTSSDDWLIAETEDHADCSAEPARSSSSGTPAQSSSAGGRLWATDSQSIWQARDFLANDDFITEHRPWLSGSVVGLYPAWYY